MKPANMNLLYSTSLFMIPTVYGYYHGKYVLSMTTFITMLASLNHWRNPVLGTRRDIDLVVSKSAGVIYFIYGYNSVHTTLFRMFGYSNGFLMLYLYIASCISHDLNSDSLWEYYHMMFHVSIVIGKMIVLSS